MDYESLRTEFGLVIRPERNVFRVLGRDRVRFIHNVTTNDVKSIRPGEGCFATVVARTGKLVGELRIKVFQDHLLVDTATPSLISALERFVVMDDVRFEPAALKVVELVGPKRPRPPASLWGFTVEGDRILSPQPFDTTQVLLPDVAALGLKPVSEQAAEIVRIENGWPKWGAELTEEIVPVEAGLEPYAISYTKGCYLGQEVLQRLKTYGEPKQRLRGLKLSKPVTPGEKVIIDGREAGFVTSCAVSPRFGPIALAYIRKEFKDAERCALGTIVPLPFS